MILNGLFARRFMFFSLEFISINLCENVFLPYIENLLVTRLQL